MFINSSLPSLHFLSPPTFLCKKDDKTSIPVISLSQDLPSLVGRISTNNSSLTEQDKKVFSQAVIKCRKFLSLVQKELPKLSKEKLDEILTDLLAEQQLNQEQIAALFDLLDTQTLLTLSGQTEASARLRVETQVSIKDEALKSIAREKSKAIWQELLPQFKDFIHHILEVLITTTGLTEIGKGRVENASEAEMKLRMYTTIIGYPALIFAAVMSIVGVASLSVALTAVIVIATVAAIIIYMRNFRPCPKDVIGLENLSRKVLTAEEPPMFHRTELLNRIKNNFRSGKGALLVGEAGCGKSSLAQAFAELVAHGEIDFLKESEVFCVNASSIGRLGSGCSFSQLEQTFKGHEKQVVFFFDEIHTLFNKNDLTGSQSDAFKTFCDRFPYVIIATTQHEYNTHIAKDENDAFIRRFGGKPIEVPPFTDEEIERSLKKELHHRAPELVWEPGVIAAIIHHAAAFNPKTSKVDASHSLLRRLISEMKTKTFPEEDETARLNAKIEALRIDLINAFDNDSGESCLTAQKELDAKKKVLEEKLEKIKEIQKKEKLYIKAKRHSYKLAQKVNKGNKHSFRHWLAHNAKVHMLEKELEWKRLNAGLPKKLDRELVATTAQIGLQVPV